MNRLEFLIRRFIASIIVLLGVSIITFFVSRVIPTNAAALYIGPRARPEEIERVTIELGLDQPLPVQYSVYLRDVLRGDWGDSIATKRPVLQEIGDRLPASLELLLSATLIAIVIGVPAGVLSARQRGRPLDLLVRGVSIMGVSVPAFFLGMIFQITFFRMLDIFPLSGRFDNTLRFTNPIEMTTGFFVVDTILQGNWVAFRSVVWHLILPALTLAAYPIGLIARMTRATMLEVLAEDYIRTARAYGIRERFIVYVYALKNAISPTLTIIGLTFAYSLTGAFFVELIFNWPGLGQFTVNSLLNVDYPAIMGVTLFGAIGYILVNLTVDLLQAWIDPRISLGTSS